MKVPGVESGWLWPAAGLFELCNCSTWSNCFNRKERHCPGQPPPCSKNQDRPTCQSETALDCTWPRSRIRVSPWAIGIAGHHATPAALSWTAADSGEVVRMASQPFAKTRARAAEIALGI